MIPLRAVTIPTESIFVTSSYVNVPPTLTFPLNVPVVPLNSVAVITPATPALIAVPTLN